jgi:hypothetical protein
LIQQISRQKATKRAGTKFFFSNMLKISNLFFSKHHPSPNQSQIATFFCSKNFNDTFLLMGRIIRLCSLKLDSEEQKVKQLCFDFYSERQRLILPIFQTAEFESDGLCLLSHNKILYMRRTVYINERRKMQPEYYINSLVWERNSKSMIVNLGITYRMLLQDCVNNRGEILLRFFFFLVLLICELAIA